MQPLITAITNWSIMITTYYRSKSRPIPKELKDFPDVSCGLCYPSVEHHKSFTILVAESTLYIFSVPCIYYVLVQATIPVPVTILVSFLMPFQFSDRASLQCLPLQAATRAFKCSATARETRVLSSTWLTFVSLSAIRVKGSGSTKSFICILYYKQKKGRCVTSVHVVKIGKPDN